MRGLVIPEEERAALRAKYPKGRRVVAVKFSYDPEHDSIDDNLNVPAGTEGTVTMVDDAGQVAVDWDNGARISALVLEGDRIAWVEDSPAA